MLRPEQDYAGFCNILMSGEGTIFFLTADTIHWASQKTLTNSQILEVSSVNSLV